MTWLSPGDAGAPLVALLGRLGGLLDRLDAILGRLGVFLGHLGGLGGLPRPSWKTEARIICCFERDRGLGSADLVSYNGSWSMESGSCVFLFGGEAGGGGAIF